MPLRRERIILQQRARACGERLIMPVKPDHETSVERLAREVEASLSELELYFGAVGAQALRAYVTAQIALLNLEFRALAIQSAEEELGVIPARQKETDAVATRRR